MAKWNFTEELIRNTLHIGLRTDTDVSVLCTGKQSPNVSHFHIGQMSCMVGYCSGCVERLIAMTRPKRGGKGT